MVDNLLLEARVLLTRLGKNTEKGEARWLPHPPNVGQASVLVGSLHMGGGVPLGGLCRTLAWVKRWQGARLGV